MCRADLQQEQNHASECDSPYDIILTARLSLTDCDAIGQCHTNVLQTGMGQDVSKLLKIRENNAL